MCIRKDGNMYLNIFNSLKECCITRRDEVPSELCRSLQSTTNKAIKLACTIIYFMYAFHITEETSLKLLRERFKHFSGALCLPTQVMNHKTTGFTIKKKKKSYSMLKSTSETHLEPIFLCIKIPWSESPPDLRDVEINWTLCWNTSSLGQLPRSCGATEEQT